MEETSLLGDTLIHETEEIKLRSRRDGYWLFVENRNGEQQEIMENGQPEVWMRDGTKV
jgi:hypothetical protein